MITKFQALMLPQQLFMVNKMILTKNGNIHLLNLLITKQDVLILLNKDKNGLKDFLFNH